MKIELLPNERNYRLIDIFLNEEFFRTIHTMIFGKKPRLSLTKESYQEEFDQLELSQAKLYAFRRLAVRAYLSFELEKCLKERLVSQKTIKKVLQECTMQGFLDDAAWIDYFISKEKRLNKGPQMILKKLYQKGIPLEKAKELISQKDSPEKRQEEIKRLLQGRYASRDLSVYQEREKVIAALSRRGYDYREVKNVLQEEDFG